MYNTRGLKFLSILCCFTANQVTAPTKALISQATQVPFEFFAFFFCSDQSEQLFSTAKLGNSYVPIKDLEIQKLIEHLETPAAKALQIQ